MIVISFRTGGDEFVAVGKQPNTLRVWEIDEGNLIETPLRWPACTRFMHYVDMDEPREAAWEEIAAGYKIVRRGHEG